MKDRRYIIPEYSLTGDLLAFETCGLQYRYYNRGALPPSTPVQLWFGEFIHSVMEEAYLAWRDLNRRRFPWPWLEEIRPLELQISQRLRAAGLYPNRNVFCPYSPGDINGRGVCSDGNHPHKMSASRRAEAAINTWGQHLFPLISDVEVKLKGLRAMPNFQPGRSRSNHYGITGIIDVISSVNLSSAPAGNLILHSINELASVRGVLSSLAGREYEVIIDYKGMRRPPSNLPGNRTWIDHEMQILTYAWLRSQQPGARPIAAGILFYLNELDPSKTDLVQLKSEVSQSQTDILPSGADAGAVAGWSRMRPVPPLSRTFLEARSIRVIPIDTATIGSALTHFDTRVEHIERAVDSEMNGTSIITAWPTNPVQATCSACDFKTFCPRAAPHTYAPTAP